MKKLIATTTLLFILSLLSGCQEVNPFSSRPLVVAVLISSNSNDKDSLDVLRGAQFAIDYYNKSFEQFGAKKFSFVLVPIELDTHTAESVTKAVTTAITSYNAHLIIGGMRSQEAMIISEVAREQQIPFISPTATASAVSEASRFSFGNAPSLFLQTEAAVHFILRDLQFGTLGILYDGYEPLSVERGEMFNRTFRNMGGNEVFMQSFSGKETFSQSAVSVLRKKPEVIFLTTNSSPTLLEQIQILKNLGFNGAVFNLSAQYMILNQEAIEEIGLNVFGVASWLPYHSTDLNLDFIKNFKAEFGKEPNLADAMIHDSFLRLFASLKNVKNITRLGVQEAIGKTKSLDGLSGKYIFSYNKTLKTLWIIEINEGGFFIPQILTPSHNLF